jgi:transposase
LLVFHGIEVKRPNRNWEDKSFLDLRKLDLGPSLKIALEVLIKQLESLLGLRNQLRIELKELCKKKRYVNTFRLIKSIPGIGWFTAIRLVLEFGEDMSRFARANQIASFVGLVSSEYSSGETVRRGRITGQGRSFIRGWLIECAWVAIRKDPALLDKFNRVWRNSGSKKKAIVAVARVLVIRLRSCVLYDNPYIIGVIQ